MDSHARKRKLLQMCRDYVMECHPKLFQGMRFKLGMNPFVDKRRFKKRGKNGR